MVGRVTRMPSALANASRHPIVGPMPDLPHAIEDAERAGFDLTLVDESLRLTHEERARQHDQALALVLELDLIRNERNAKSQSPLAATR